MKGHIIAKIILTIPIVILFVATGVSYQNINENNLIKRHTNILTLEADNDFDKVDIIMIKMTNKLYYVIKPMAIYTIWMWSIVVSVIFVLLLDQILGVGRNSPMFK